jgi:nitrogen regulatory protein PII
MGKDSKTPGTQGPINSFFSKLSSRFKKNGHQESVPAQQEMQRNIPVMKLIIFIIDWTKTNMISSVFVEEKVRFHFITRGRGTASSEVLDLLGIGVSEKAVVLCLEQEVMVPVLLKEVRKKIGLHSPGAGIAFTVPLSGINNPILKVFKESIHKNEKLAAEKANPHPERRRGEIMDTEIKNDLIISIINQGYSDEFMATAKEAGATGGTVLNARALAHEGAIKFFGVSVQDEKEIIIILTNREKKVPIMQAISRAHGMDSKAEGIVFSLPVDSVMGLSFE